MKITVIPHDDRLFVLDVSEDTKLIFFKKLCEFETGIPSQQTQLTHNGQLLLDDFKTMKTLGVQNEDVVIIQNLADSTAEIDDTSSNNILPHLDLSRTPTTSDRLNSSSDAVGQQQIENAEYLKNLFLSNPDQLALLKQNNPRLADALSSGKIEDFANIMAEQMEIRNRRDEQRIKMMESNSFDSETQQLIEEEIRKKNIETNMEAALEYNPENFGRVTMLYINCKVNGHSVKAFIDSGAQITMMSSACANECNIMRLVDSRWTGIAKGVGEQKIIGRIHMVQLSIENDFLTTSFSVLENQPMCIILGLDVLKRHQCCIDLKNNILKIGTTGTETPFLPDNEIPKFEHETPSRNE